MRSFSARVRGRTWLAATLGVLAGALTAGFATGGWGGGERVRTVSGYDDRAAERALQASVRADGLDRFAYRELERLSGRTCRNLSRPALARAFGSKVPAERDADGHYLALAYAERVRINPIRLQQAAYDGCLEGIAQRHAPDLDKVSFQPAPASLVTAATRVRATASPVRGSSSTVFRVSFRSGGNLGVAGGRRRTYVLEVDGPQVPGCAHDRDAYVDHGAARKPLGAELDPAAGKGGTWCRGHYRGRIIYHDGFACPDIGTCVEPGPFQPLARTVGRFEFTVR